MSEIIKGKNILMLTPFHKQQRGNTITALRLFKALSKEGFAIDLISFEDLEWRINLRKLLESKKIDLIHAFNARYTAEAYIEIPELSHIPLILTSTGTDINHDIFTAQGNKIEQVMQNAQAIVVFHKDLVQQLTSNYPELAPKINVIPQGVNLPLGTPKKRSELDLSEDDLVFLMPSGIRPIKNIMMAVNGLKEAYLEYPQIRLLLIGPVIDLEYSKQVFEYISSHSWIRYLGEVVHDDIASYLAIGDIVINTSFAEGQPQAALEAMSLGKTAILSAVPGNFNLIQDGKEGLYVRNESELNKAARFLSENLNTRKDMGRAAAKLIEARFSLAAEVKKYSEIYTKILQSNDNETT